MNDFWNFLNDWVPLPISLFAAFYSFKNYVETRPKIDILQIDNTNSSTIIEPDRIKDDIEYPDRIWTKKYRVISDIVIMNKSSKPITIIEVILNDKYIYNSYTDPGTYYKVTTVNNKSEFSGLIAFGGNEESLVFSIEDEWLNLLIDIAPNSAVRGHLLFSFDDLDKVKVGKNKLEIITSRKRFKTELLITEKYCSQLLQQDKFDFDKYQSMI